MKKTKIFALLTLFLTIALVGCTRSASTLPVEEATEDPIESIFSTVATQTALAAQGGGEGETPVLPEETEKPTRVSSATPESTATNTPAPTSEVSVPSTYTLHEGEWPYCLARRFDIEADSLLSANGLKKKQAVELSVGTILTIPAGAPAYGGQRSLRSHPTTYTASGIDTFFSIACQFGDVWPEHIAEANGKKLKYKPSGGEQLLIP